MRLGSTAMTLDEWGRRLAPWSVGLLACLLLAPFVGLDPVRGVTFSNAPFSDEAWNLVGARNIVLFGHPSTDEWQIWLLALPFTVVEAFAFALFGIKLAVARLVVVAAVALTGVVIVRSLGSVVGHRQAGVAAIAYVTSGLILFYGRLAFAEPLVGLFLAVGIASLVPAARGNALRWGLVGGAALALAVMTKAIAVGAAAAVVLVVLVAAVRASWARRWLAGAVPIAAAIAVAWALCILWPNRDAVGTVVGTIYPPIRFPTTIGAALRRLAHFPFADGMLSLSLPLLVLAFAGGLRVAALWLRGDRTMRPAGSLTAPIAAAAALAASLGLLGIVTYQPNRYVVAFLPAAAVLAAWAFPSRLLATPTRKWAAPLAAAILTAAPGLVLQAGWLRTAGTEIAGIQPVASRAIPDGATIAGQYAPLVALGDPVRTVVPFNTVNGGDLYAAGVRYLIWIDAGPDWMAAHPAAWAARESLGCMMWGVVPTRSCIYRLPDPVP